MVAASEESIDILVIQRLDEGEGLAHHCVAEAQLAVFVGAADVDVTLLGACDGVVQPSSNQFDFFVPKVFHELRSIDILVAPMAQLALLPTAKAVQ